MKIAFFDTKPYDKPSFERFGAENDISFNLLVLQCCKYALDHQEDANDET